MPKQKVSKHPADVFCRDILARYPNALEYERILLEQAKPDLSRAGKWPDWCALPMGGTCAIIDKCHDAEKIGDPPYHTYSGDIAPLTAALIWRRTRMVYKFDATVQNELENQPLDDKVPFNAFFHLPYPCIYIDAPSVMEAGEISSGFFVWMEFDAEYQAPEFRILWLLRDGKTASQPLPIADTLEESLLNLEISEKLRGQRFGLNNEFMVGTAKHHTRDITRAIQLALYVCSELDSDDVKPRSNPTYRTISHSDKTPREALTWDVGIRVGSSLRAYRRQESASPSSQGGDRHAPRPHLRRAHWHSFWTGSRANRGSQKLVVKWLPPIPVGFSDSEEIPTVITPVRK